MVGAERWADNWRFVSPVGAVRADVERSARKRRAASREVGELPAGTPIVLSASAPGAIGRCRVFAAEAGIELEREYLAFPSARAPAYLVEDAPAPVRVFVKEVLVAPPRARSSAPMQAGVSLLRALAPWALIRRIAPGRIVVGRRT